MSFLRRAIAEVSVRFLFALSVIIIILVALFYSRRVVLDERLERSLARAEQVRQHLESITPQARIAATATKLYVIKSDREYLQTYQEARTRVFFALSELRRLSNNSALQARQSEIRKLIVERFANLEESIREAGTDNNTDRLTALGISGDYLNARLQQKIATYIAEERHEQEQVRLERRFYQRLTPIYTWFIILFSLFIMISAYIRLSREHRLSEQLLAELKDANLQLKSANQLLAQAEHIAKMGSWQLNIDLNQFSFSDNLYRLLGYEPGAFPATLDGFNQLVHPDDQHLITQGTARAIEQRSSVPITYRAFAQNGSLMYLKADGSVIKNMEGQDVVIGTTRDVTEEHILQEALQNHMRLIEDIIDNSTDMIIVLDQEMNVRVWNKATEDVYGIKRNAILGRHIVDFFPDLLISGRIHYLRNALNGQSIINEELPYVKGFCQLTMLPLKSGINGLITGVLVICHDISEVKEYLRKQEELNEALKESNKKLQENNAALMASNAELEAFGYAASHDLQEPLRRIQAFTDLILTRERDQLSEQGKNYFNRIQNAAARMQQLIEDLLSFSRIKNEQVQFSTVSLQAVIQKVLQPYQEQLGKDGLSIDLPAPLPDVWGSTLQITQMFDNLIGNAIKYRRNGVQPVIRITSGIESGADMSLENVDTGIRYHWVKIEDNGIGFSQEYAPRIFDLFVRLHNKESYPGTGVGLAICKRVMDNHRGFITATSIPECGSVFTIFLPINQ